MPVATRTTLLISLVFLLGCRNSRELPGMRESAEETVVSGNLATVGLQPWPTIVRVQGSLFADEVTSVAARVAGRVVAVQYDLGDTVICGDTLVRLDSQEFEWKLAQAEAQLAQVRAALGLQPGDPLEKLDPANSPPVREARAVLEEARQRIQRLETLFQQGAVVANDLETAESLLSVADARFNSAMNGVREKIAMVRVQSAMLELAHQELEDTVVVAPFEGAVQSRSVAVGMYVQVGQPLMEIAKMDVLRYRASVPERFAQMLSAGQTVRISVGETSRAATVQRIAPALDPLTRSLAFEAMVDNSDGSLRGGLFAQSELVLDDQSRALVISPDSLTRFAGVDKVWIVADGRVREQVVRVGRETDQGIEILEGLVAGDQILQDADNGKTGRYSGAAPTDISYSNP